MVHLNRPRPPFQMRSDDAAFVALVDEDGTIIVSDQLKLIGEKAPVPISVQVEEITWRGEEVWVASTPLRRGRDGEWVGGLQMAVRLNRVEEGLDESRKIFRLAGLIAVLALPANAYNQMVAGLQEREWLRDMFGRFVSYEVAEAIRSGQTYGALGRRNISVL